MISDQHIAVKGRKKKISSLALRTPIRIAYRASIPSASLLKRTCLCLGFSSPMALYPIFMMDSSSLCPGWDLLAL